MTPEERVELGMQIDKILRPAMREASALILPHVMTPKEPDDRVEAMRVYLTVFLADYFGPTRAMPQEVREPMARMLAQDVLACTSNCLQEAIR